MGGAGCAGGTRGVACDAGQLKAPIVHALRGKEFIEYDNPYDVGMTGLLGFSSGYHAMMNCDVLLMLGTDFPYQQFYPKNAKIIQVDRLGEQIGRRTPVDLGLIGNVKETLNALTPLIENKSDRSFLDTCLGHYKEARKGLDDLPRRNRANLRCILNLWREFSMSSRPRTPCSPAMWGRLRFGRRAT